VCFKATFRLSGGSGPSTKQHSLKLNHQEIVKKYVVSCNLKRIDYSQGKELRSIKGIMIGRQWLSRGGGN